MGVNLRGDFPKFIAILNLSNSIYEVKTYSTKDQMQKYTARFSARGYVVERYEHNGQDYIKI